MLIINKINLCKGCGTCCRAIVLCYQTRKSFAEMKDRFHLNPDDYTTNPIHKKSNEIIFKHWIEITQERALEINPHLQKWIDSGKFKTEETMFFSCDLLDKNNKCTIHDDSPWACHGYPFYEQKETLLREDFLFYSESCGYKALCVPVGEYVSSIEKYRLARELETMVVQNNEFEDEYIIN